MTRVLFGISDFVVSVLPDLLEKSAEQKKKKKKKVSKDQFYHTISNA